MASPSIGASTTSFEGTNVTSHDVSYCSGITSGDLLVCVFTCDGAPTVTFPGGWTQIYSASNGSEVTHCAYYITATGSESGTFTVTTSAGQHSAHVVFRSASAQVTASGAGTATGTGSLANPPNCNVGTSGDYTYIATAGFDNRYALASDYKPSGYTDLQSIKSDGSNTTDSCFTYVAYLSETSSSDDPGGMNSDREEQWVAGVFALEEASAATQNINGNFISSGSTLYQPSVSTGAVNIDANFISSTATLNEPSVSVGAVNIDANFISTNTALYEPSISVGSVGIEASTITSTANVYEPSVGAWAVNIDANAIASGSTLYEPSLGTGAVDISANFISSTAVLYEPAVAGDNSQNIDSNFISSGASLYEPSITTGVVNIDATAIASSAALYEPSITSTANIDTSFINSGSTLYEPSVSVGSVNIDTNFISSGAILYQAAVTRGSTTRRIFVLT